MRLHTAFLGLLLLTSTAYADPDWWETRGVISPAPAANLAPATIGQAKHMAAMALAELQGKLPAASHQALQADVALIVNLSLPDPPPPGYRETQRAVLLNGQLKALAKPFYDHLRTHDATWLDNSMAAGKLVVMEPGTDPPVPSPYPWSVATTDDANLAPATLGQLKAVFSLPLELLSQRDTDADGMPDAWELLYALNPASASDAGLDLDNDGLTNLQEYQWGANPTNPDTDGDGMPDGWENLYGLDPNNASDASGDLVGDGVTNLVKYKTGRNPLVVALTDTAGTLALKVHTPLE